jgi:hypothetical protein
MLTLKLNFILNNQRLALWIDRFVEFGGNGMMSSLVLHDETFVTNHTGEHSGFLDSPVANIGPFFLSALLLFFLGVRRLPPTVPIRCELFEERGLEFSGLDPRC